MNHTDQNNTVEVKDLKKWFFLRGGFFQGIFGKGPKQCLKAVDGVSFAIKGGEILGLAGESGCGKSTTGMTLLKLYEPTSGKIFFSNRDISEIKRKGHLKEFRKNAQIVFQNPYESINPRFTVFQWVEEPLRIHYTDRKGEHVHMVLHALERAGLFPAHFFLDRYPHELSGGQLQRIAIARAIAVEPSLLIADEPVSMLDVSIRAGILNLLKQFCTESNMAILYISHDLSTMKHICTSVAIMYMGRIVEMGDSQQVLNAPQHPYARALVAAIPQMKSKLGRKRVLLEGAVPNPIHLPTGCRFHPRCPEVKPICREEEPELLVLEDRCQVACHVIRL